KLASDWAEETGTTWVVIVGLDDDGSVGVGRDVGAVWAAGLLLGADDDGKHGGGFLDGAACAYFLDGCNQDIANGSAAPDGAAKHADDQDFPGTRVVSYSHARFLLKHFRVS